MSLSELAPSGRNSKSPLSFGRTRNFVRHQRADRPTLTLIPASDPIPPPGLQPMPPAVGEWRGRIEERLLHRRPGDHVELLRFSSTKELRLLRKEARERGLHPDTAIALLCERRLVCIELEELGLGSVEAKVDIAAAKAEPRLGVGAANHAYLRALHHGDPLERASRAQLGSEEAAVPIRLFERLERAEVLAGRPLGAGELTAAIRWETAAIYAGQLMGEWAFHTTLTTLTAALSRGEKSI
jgi:hypothetical protein